MADVQKILESHSSSPSRWRENAEWRKANRKWLKKSQQIAMAVLDYMDKVEMNQKELAEAMNVTPQYISKILKGNQNLSLETISKLEEILDINILIIQNFNTIQPVAPITDWNRPEFKDLKTSQEYNKTTIFSMKSKKVDYICTKIG